MKVGRAPHTGPILNVATLNVNGLRANPRRGLLAKLLKDLQVGISILTGTHLRSVNLKNIKYPKNNAMAASRRPRSIRERIGGGASILFIQTSRRRSNLKSMVHPRPLNTASAKCAQQRMKTRQRTARTSIFRRRLRAGQRWIFSANYSRNYVNKLRENPRRASSVGTST